jgi:hypothetical protein
VTGAASAVGAFLAFGLSPLAAVPSARADELDWLADLVDPALGAVSGVDAAEAVGGVAGWFDSAALSADNACGDVCNGVAGTQADPDGGNGGVIYGDGGSEEADVKSASGAARDQKSSANVVAISRTNQRRSRSTSWIGTRYRLPTFLQRISPLALRRWMRAGTRRSRRPSGRESRFPPRQTG